MMWWGHTSGWAYAAMSLGMFAFLAFLAWAVVATGRTERGHADCDGASGSDKKPTAGAERILAERFARGEIDADEYQSRLADLHQQHPAGTRS